MASQAAAPKRAVYQARAERAGTPSSGPSTCLGVRSVAMRPKPFHTAEAPSGRASSSSTGTRARARAKPMASPA